MSNAVVPATGFGEWDVESLRLSVFHSGESAPSGLWEQLMGIAPESSDTRAREGTVREQGIADGNMLLLITQSRRLDWNLVPSLNQSGDRGGMPTLMAVEETMPLLRRALDVSVRACGRVDRFALGGVLTQQASSLSEGLGQLSKYLPRLDLENQGGFDFAYQINKRRRSLSALHVQVNRLSRWQLEELQGGTITVGPSRAPNFEISERAFVSKLTLDINTALDSNAISKTRMPNLFDELVNFACEIATEGDIP